MTLEQISILLKSCANHECLIYTISTGKHFACYWQGCPSLPGTLELCLHTDYRDDTAYLLYHNKAVSDTLQGISFFHDQGPRAGMDD